MRDQDIQPMIRAVDSLREVMAFFASDHASQVAESHRIGGLDCWVEEGQVRAMEKLRDFGASFLFDESIWTDLWKFTDEVIAAYIECNGCRTDADALSKPVWDRVRQRAMRLMPSLPGPIDEYSLQAAIRGRPSDTEHT